MDSVEKICSQSLQISEGLARLELVHVAVEEDMGVAARPFVLCGLPLRRSRELVHTRSNGDFLLRIKADPEFGLPFGQDALILIAVATLAQQPWRLPADPLRERYREDIARERHISQERVLVFESGAQLLDLFGLAKDGRYYKRLIEGFQRLSNSTIHFANLEEPQVSKIWDSGEYLHFFDRLRLWYHCMDSRAQAVLSDTQFYNVVIFSEQFARELRLHPLPTDLGLAGRLAGSPGALYFAQWVAYRSYRAAADQELPLFTPTGVMAQMGVPQNLGQREFRRYLRDWIDTIERAGWYDLPVDIAPLGQALLVRPQAKNPTGLSGKGEFST